MAPRTFTLLVVLFLAGCGNGRGILSAPVIPLRVAVVGDSISKIVIEPVSPTPCIQAVGPLPDCQYDTSGAGSWPTALAESIGVVVTNLAVPGVQTDWMIANEVPSIAIGTDVVIYEGGTNDIAYTGQAPTDRITAILMAIRFQAPQARIIMLGVRDFDGAAAAVTLITAWNAFERSQTNATYVDLRSHFPANDLSDFPDGTHPSSSGVQRIADLVSQAIH